MVFITAVKLFLLAGFSVGVEYPVIDRAEFCPQSSKWGEDHSQISVDIATLRKDVLRVSTIKCMHCSHTLVSM